MYSTKDTLFEQISPETIATFVTVYMPLLVGKCGTLVVDISSCASSLVETSDIRDESTYYIRRI